MSLPLSACSPRTLRTEGEQTGASLNYSWQDFQQSLALLGVVLEASPGRQPYTRSDCHLQGSPGTGPARILLKHTGTEVVTKTKGSCGRVVVATNATKHKPRSLPLSKGNVSPRSARFPPFPALAALWNEGRHPAALAALRGDRHCNFSSSREASASSPRRRRPPAAHPRASVQPLPPEGRHGGKLSETLREPPRLLLKLRLRPLPFASRRRMG